MTAFNIGEQVISGAHGDLITGIVQSIHHDAHGEYIAIALKPNDRFFHFRAAHECCSLETPMTASAAPTKARAKKAKTPAEQPISRPMPFQPGSYVYLQSHTKVGGVLAYHVLSSPEIDVLLLGGQTVRVLISDCLPDTYSSAAPFRQGDRVVMARKEGSVSVVEAKRIGVHFDREAEINWIPKTMAKSNLRVLRRVEIQDMYADLGVAWHGAPTPDQPVQADDVKPATRTKSRLTKAAPTAAAEPQTAPVQAPSHGLQSIPWNKLLSSPLNPRKHFDHDALVELAVSIARKGLKQNLVARPHPERPGCYEIAAGERRWRAIGLLVQSLAVGEGQAREELFLPADHPVPVLVEPMTDLELLEIGTAENVQRRRMTPLEEADAFAALVKHGMEVAEIVSRFGYHRRLVVCRIQISEHLIPELRQKLDEKIITTAQAEVLALAGPEVQLAFWKNQLRSNPRTPPEQIRALLNDRLFQVRYREFPAIWYTGAIAQDDLFGDIEPHYLDSAQAMELQLKHTTFLADKDVRNGAAFADVVLQMEAALHRYDQGGTGVVYWIHAQTGELKRYEGRGARQTNYGQPNYRAEQRVQAHETLALPLQPEEVARRLRPPPAPPSQPALPQRQAQPSVAEAAPKSVVKPSADLPKRNPNAHYPSDYRTISELLAEQMLNDPRFGQAVMLTGAMNGEYMPVATGLPDQYKQAAQAIAAGSELFRAGEGNQTLLSVDEAALDPSGFISAEQYYEAVLPVLLAAPQEAVATLCYLLACREGKFTAGPIRGVIARLGETVQRFQLTAAYLADCDHEALLELWADAEQPSEANGSDEYLRAMLLELAPKLAEEGFLPRPLRRDA